MFLTYTNPVYEYVKSTDQQAASVCHHPVIVVGAGPIGMGAALDLGQYGQQVLMLANHIGDLTVLQQAMDAAREDI